MMYCCLPCRLIGFLGIFVFLINSVFGQADPVRAKLLSEVEAFKPGETFWMGVHFEMDEGWHIYSKDPGDAGVATTIKWDLPEGVIIGDFLWPMPVRFETVGIESYGYKDEVLLMAPITVPIERGSQDVTLKASVDWLACEDICIPGNVDLSMTLPRGEEALVNKGTHPLFERTRGYVSVPEVKQYTSSLEVMLGFAFLGGLILNLMPCVFPVIGLKIMGFVEQSGASAWKLRLHGFIFGFGVLVSFWMLAGALLILRYTGAQLGWGFQLQSPLFVVFLILLFFLMGLNFAGLFEWGTFLMGVGQEKARQSGYTGSFLSGVLATLVATPCTGPFMGTALGFALAQPAWVSLLIFSTLALGLASPYILLAFVPKWINALPRPGAWMETLKQILSFPLFATVIWLMWVLGKQAGINAVAIALSALLFISISAWLYGRWRGLKIKIIALCFFIGAGWLGYQATQLPAAHLGGVAVVEDEWEPFSLEEIQRLRASGHPVFVDFTAAWCLTCQVNKVTTLRTQKIKNAFKDAGVALMVADWTDHDPVITQALASFNRSGVPLYVLYPADVDAEPILLPSILTPDIVLDSLKQL